MYKSADFREMKICGLISTFSLQSIKVQSENYTWLSRSEASWQLIWPRPCCFARFSGALLLPALVPSAWPGVPGDLPIVVPVRWAALLSGQRSARWGWAGWLLEAARMRRAASFWQTVAAPEQIICTLFLRHNYQRAHTPVACPNQQPEQPKRAQPSCWRARDRQPDNLCPVSDSYSQASA